MKMPAVMVQLLMAATLFFPVHGQSFRVMFYNAENLFDTYDDSLAADEYFLPESDTRWNNGRFRHKITGLYKVIAEAGGWEGPAVAGLCEVENREVLERLLNETPLSRYDYGIIHQDSPDPRGIDVALIYRKDLFLPDATGFLQPDTALSGGMRTRDVLYVRGRLGWQDTVHILVNHWPSRRGGEAASAGRRMILSNLVKKLVDSLLLSDPRSAIIVMGDFNDEPWDLSLQNLCRSTLTSGKAGGMGLVNLMVRSGTRLNEGTINHGGFWLIFDQVLVSPSLVEKDNMLTIRHERAFVLRSDYLLERNADRWSDKPYRTYRGPVYAGGYSDHLPVYVEIIKKWHEVSTDR